MDRCLLSADNSAGHSTYGFVQDVLVVTAPGSGAEVIPFLKTYVNLPMAIGFSILYAKVSPGLSHFALQLMSLQQKGRLPG